MTHRAAPSVALCIGGAILFVGFIASWHFLGKMNPYDEFMTGSGYSAQVPIELHDVEIRTRHSGIPQWSVRAALLTISPDRRSICANTLTGGILYKNTKPVMFFSAGRVAYGAASLSPNTDIVVDGGVTADIPRLSAAVGAPLRISTQTVEWDKSTSTVTCPGTVAFTIPNLGFGTSQGITYNSATKHVVFGAIEATAGNAAMDSAAPTQGAASAPVSSTPKPAEQNNQLRFKGKGAFWDDSVLTIPGSAEFDDGTAKVLMDGATYNHKTDTAQSSSPVTITDTDTTITGDLGSVNFDTHIAILTGHVKMFVLPRPEDKVSEQAAKKPTTITCDQVNYDYRQKQAHTTGTVVISQPTRTVTADDGHYDVNLKIVDLNGHVKYKSTDGAVMNAPSAKVSVDPKDEWVQVEGPVSGLIPLSSQDNPLAASSGSSGAAKPVKSAQKSTTTGNNQSRD